MSGEYEIGRRTTCTACTGTGIAVTREWVEFYSFVAERAEEVGQTDLRWMLDNKQACDDWWADSEHYVEEGLPPEEGKCGKCAGTGKVYQTVPFREAFEAEMRRVCITANGDWYLVEPHEVDQPKEAGDA